MAIITYIEHNGTEHQVEVDAGATVMTAAVDNQVPGIDADCGGGCSCATCHVIVNDDWMARVGQPDEAEEGMLAFVPERHPGSRLSCQIYVTEELDGLRVQMPEFQM